MNWIKDEYTLTDQFDDLDFETIHHFLKNSYWAAEIPKALVKKSCQNSLCFGIYKDKNQVGFGRIVTDYATFAFISDVFVLEAHRKKGLADWMLSCMREHPRLQGLRRWMLATLDAHALYAQHGFQALKHPDWFMEIANPDIYKQPPDQR